MSRDDATVLFLNEAFYTAFRGRDLLAMHDLWARAAPVSCIHPGWQAIEGREEVMESWRAILGGEGSPDIRCLGAKARLLGETALVVCYEALGGRLLVASNVFVREDETWRLIHHQAGPCQLEPGEVEALLSEQDGEGEGSLQ